ncbi:general transcriptional corepressor trfA isoform X1 [Microplitis mediator]|uniref:general transcriptional corepressor trfA isoform X1 n=1 Tax=Microplitis mediator TaxID=375433 RepID=UPI002555117D|nr:general transcriptional corepressor trfA isoform X1 [Microplitis mediator]
MGGFAWVTMVTNDSYSLGALVLAHSLKRAGTRHDLAVLITPGVTAAMREKLSSVFTLVQEVNVLDSRDESNLALLARPELGITFTKLHCWRLTQYEKCVFVDADTLVIRNCDELFEREELSAAPDVGWPDCFNSGVFVFKPSQQTFASLTAFAASKGSFDGGDQGLLNLYFSDWAHKDISKHLPFIYNMCSTATYSYLPAYKQFGEEVRIIHFIGSTKPWLQHFDTQTGIVHPSPDSNHVQSLLQHWWNIFCRDVHSQLSPAMLSKEHRDPHFCEITSTLARREHNLFVTISSAPSRNTVSSRSNRHVCHTPTDFTYDKADSISNNYLTEFKDPWDHYVEVTNATNNDNSHAHNNNNEHYNEHNNEHCNEHNNEHNNEHYQPEIPFKNNEINFDHQDTVHRLHDTINITSNYNDHKNDSNFDTTDNNREFINFQTLPININSNFDPNTDNLQKINEFTVKNNLQTLLEFNNTHNYNNSRENMESKAKKNRDELNNVRKINDNFPTDDRLNLNHKKNDDYHDHAVFKSIKNNVDSKSFPESYTEFKNISIESEIRFTGQVEADRAGIAGALSKITLGEARSPEQVAFEEHMRKQSWEEGQIDYMGRDSFDNIWKKICSTVFVVPETEKPKPKEKIVEEVKEKSKTSPSVATKTPLTEDAPAKEIKQGVASEYHLRTSPEENKNANDLTKKGIQEKSSNVVLAVISAPPRLCIKKSGEAVSNKELTSTPETSKQEEKPTIPLGFTRESDDPTCKDESTESKLDTTSKESSCARTIPESPVPIQVAESVLEADIKESVSEDIKPVTEEAISSISAPIQESISTVVQAPLEPSPPAQSPSVEASPIMQPNGNAFDIDLRSINNTPTRSSAPVSTPAPTPVPALVPTPVSVSTPTSTPLSSTGFSSPSVPIPTTELTSEGSASKETSKTQLEEQKKITETESIPVGTSSSRETEAAVKSDSCRLTSKAISETKSDTTLKTTEDNVPEEVPKTSEEVKPESEIKPVGSRDKTELLSEAKETEPAVPERVEEIVTGKEESLAASSKDEQVPESSQVSEKSQPKELIIPGTPTVIEATPPTSPPLEVTASLTEAIKVEKPEKEKGEKSEKKVVKKIIKKSSEEKSEGGETDDGKKVTKKVVKKVVKKIKDPSDDTAESGSSTGDKPKKVIKVVKKTTKSVQSLDPDTSVPDTPPPATSQMPVPPKRKLKPATTKSSKKTEQEPPTNS